MKILVTGAAGFIGRVVVSELCNRGYHVIAMVRRSEQVSLFKDAPSVSTVVADLAEPDSLWDAMRCGVDAVIHLAGVVWGDTSYMYSTLVDGTQNLIEVMRQTAVPRLILVSSLSVYDWSKVDDTLTESSPIDQDSAERQGPYSLAKQRQEAIARALCKESGIQLTVLRPGGVVAPDNFDAADLGPRLGAIQIVVSPLRRLRIVNVKHVADALAAACIADLPDRLAVNLVDDVSVTAWELARRLSSVRKGCRFMLPLPYPVIMGLANLIYPVAKSLGFARFVPGILSPSRIPCRFKAVDCDISLWRKYLPLQSNQPFLALFQSSLSSSSAEVSH